MGRKPRVIEKHLLEREYWENSLSIREIAQKYYCAKDTVNKLMAKYDIPVRTASLTSVKSNRRL